MQAKCLHWLNSFGERKKILDKYREKRYNKYKEFSTKRICKAISSASSMKRAHVLSRIPMMHGAHRLRLMSADTSDVLTATPMALTDKNLYAYCDNNPIMRRDDGGEFWDVIGEFFYNIGSAKVI